MDRYPYSIVWTPLPFLSWFIPLIGHTGIANSDGLIYDFGGSHYIAIDNFTFGRPTKYLRLDPNKVQSNAHWDDAIEASANRFCERRHNLITNNCHHHVADTLNQMKYNGRNDYSPFHVFLMITFQSKYVGFKGFLKQWFVFIVLVFITIAICLSSV